MRCRPKCACVVGNGGTLSHSSIAQHRDPFQRTTMQTLLRQKSLVAVDKDILGHGYLPRQRYGHDWRMKIRSFAVVLATQSQTLVRMRRLMRSSHQIFLIGFCVRCLMRKIRYSSRPVPGKGNELQCTC